MPEDGYSEKSLQVVDGCSILDKEDFDSLSNIMEEIEHGFITVQRWRTEYEARHSVLVDAKFPTPDAKYWQSVREQAVQFNQLVMLSFDYRKNQVKLKRLKHRVERLREKLADCYGGDAIDAKANAEFSIEGIIIEIDKTLWLMRQQREDAKHRVREVMQWSKIKAEVEPSMEFGKDDCGAHQHVSYLLRFMRQSELVKRGNAAMSGPEAINLLSQLDNAANAAENKELVAKIIQEGQEKLKKGLQHNKGKKKKRKR